MDIKFPLTLVRKDKDPSFVYKFVFDETGTRMKCVRFDGSVIGTCGDSTQAWNAAIGAWISSGDYSIEDNLVEPYMRHILSEMRAENKALKKVLNVP